MTIPITAAQYIRVAEQCLQNVVGIQRDILRSALSWKATAQAQSLPVETLASYVVAVVAELEKRIDWHADLKANQDYSNVVAALGTRGAQESDIDLPIAAMSTVIASLKAAPVTSYATIIVACDAVLAATPPLLSLWPE